MEERKKSYYRCLVDGCLNSTVNGEMSFFSIPTVLERRTEWLRLIHREDLIDSSCRHVRVCEAHFSTNCIIVNSNRKLLRKNSTPQLLLPLPCTFEDKEVQAVIATTNANNIAEAEQSLEEVPVTIKEEIEDVFSEHEDDLIEKLENRKRSNETILPDVEPVKLRKIEQPEVLPVEIDQGDAFNSFIAAPFPMDFMKTVMDSQNEILAILKSQMFLQDPDEELMKFLRLVGERLQGLDSDKRLEKQNLILKMLNENE